MRARPYPRAGGTEPRVECPVGAAAATSAAAITSHASHACHASFTEGLTRYGVSVINVGWVFLVSAHLKKNKKVHSL